MNTDKEITNNFNSKTFFKCNNRGYTYNEE